MKFSVVIVNYNVKYYLEQCLCSLYRAIDNLSAEIFVVDNASVDDSEAYLTERFPRITYIYNKENVGFARANNQAIRQVKGEYVLLLNPDTVLPEQTLEEALLFMDTHPCVGAAGVKMLTDDGRFLRKSKRGYPTLAATFGKLRMPLTGWKYWQVHSCCCAVLHWKNPDYWMKTSLCMVKI